MLATWGTKESRHRANGVLIGKVTVGPGNKWWRERQPSGWKIQHLLERGGSSEKGGV